MGIRIRKNIMKEADYNRIPNNLKKLVTTQNKIIRAKCRKPKFNKETNTFTNSAPLYKKHKILRLKELYLYNLGILVFEHYHNDDFPELIAEKLKTNETPMNTRSNNLNLKYGVPKYFRTYCKPSIAGSIFWNSLPSDIKNIDNRNIFIARLKEYLIDKINITI